MKLKILVALLVLIPFLVTNVAFAEPMTTRNPELSDEQSEIDSYTVVDGNLNLAPVAGNTDIAVHNQGWMPERPKKFKYLKYFHWATYIKVLAPGTYWVGISIPLITYLDGTKQYVKYVEFCAESSKGAKSMPDYWKIVDNYTALWSDSVSWPADNDRHCIGHTFTPGQWMEDIGVSVRLNYKNTDHVISMDKAWVKISASP